MKPGFDVLTIRSLLEDDASALAREFDASGWSKPEDRFLDYYAEQQHGIRECWVALWQGMFAGYVTLHWIPLYPGIAGKAIPEVQDLNVLPPYRRRGIASHLLDRAEASARQRSRVVAIGVGLHASYGPAQRLYVQRGYVPDGFGVTYEDRYVEEGEVARFDDALVLHLTKAL